MNNNIVTIEAGQGDTTTKSHRSLIPKSIKMNEFIPISFGIVVGLCLLAFYIVLIQNQKLETLNEPNIYFNHNHSDQNSTVAEVMYHKIKILCWVMTSKNEHKSKAIHIQQTWGKRCNKLVFVSTIEDIDINAIAIPTIKGSNALWRRTMESLKYIYKHYIESADWFLKVDDDTYVIMENLRQMLFPYSKDMPVYFSCRVNNYDQEPNPLNIQRSGGYILSKESIKRFVERGLENKSRCRCYTGYTEAFGMARCMEKIRVAAGDTRDSNGRGRFLNFAPQIPTYSSSESLQEWYKGFMENSKDERGYFRYSDYAVSFINIQPIQMYVLEYLIYHLRPYGIHYKTDITPEKVIIDDSMNIKISNASSRLYQILSEYDDLEN